MISKTPTRTYEANGLLASLTYPGSTGSSEFVYNANNPLESVQVPGLPPNHDTLRYTYRWQAISEVTMPGSLKRIVTTDALLRPERIRVGTMANPDSLTDHRYPYVEVCNVNENVLKPTVRADDYVAPCSTSSRTCMSIAVPAGGALYLRPIPDEIYYRAEVLSSRL